MRLAAPELRARAEEARGHYADCDLCAHRCRVDRTHGPAGRCHEGDGLFLAGAGVHFGEEQPLVGASLQASANSTIAPPRDAASARRGSGLVLIGGCNLACRSCETADFSLERRGLVPASAEGLAALFLDLERKGAANLNLVTPTHVLPALLAGLAVAAGRGFSLPLVWNCGGYESLEALRLLDGVVDIYLPDAKYGSDALAEQLSGCKGYTAALRESLAEMWRQVGPLQLDAGGLASRGVLVRHLVLPNDAASSREVMQLCAAISPQLAVNVMSQYRPLHRASLLPLLARRPTKGEVELAVRAAHAAGLQEILLDGRPLSS